MYISFDAFVFQMRMFKIDNEKCFLITQYRIRDIFYKFKFSFASEPVENGLASCFYSFYKKALSFKKATISRKFTIDKQEQ